jgi:hypothetical protein
MAALEPVNKRHRRKGQKATLDTVCFMEFFLLRMMRRLHENMQDVIRMPLLKPEDSDSSLDNERYYLDSDSGSGEIYLSD